MDFGIEFPTGAASFTAPPSRCRPQRSCVSLS